MSFVFGPVIVIYGLMFTIAGVIVALDQWTKWLVRSNVPFGGSWLPESLEWLSPYARIVNWHNTGAAFGMFQGGSMVFTVLTLSQLGHVLAIRSERESLFTQGVLSNRTLIITVLLTVALQMAVLYVPAFNPIFKTQPLSWDELALCLALSSVVFVGVEIEKALVRRGWIYLSRP